MSSVEVPGRKIAETPCSFRRGMSSCGMMPPTMTRQSSIPRSRRSSTMRGQSVLCAPLKIDTPTASTSSCNAAAAIISGV